MTALNPTPEQLETSLKRSVAALERAGIPYLLGGSLASWARGGPQSRNDLDLMVKPEDAERALSALVEVGMREERPPEQWLFKAWDGDVQVDLVFGPEGLPMTDETVARGEDLRVMGMNVRVMGIEDVIVTKLLAIDENNIRYESLLEIARALREQVDWASVRARTSRSPFGPPFFRLLEELGIVPEPAAQPARETTVRVLGARDR